MYHAIRIQETLGSTGEVQLHYEAIGEGKPVVLLHGFGCDHRLMTGCMEPVFLKHPVPGYRRYYIDLPGMGLSKAPLIMATADEILEVLVRFLTEVVKERFLLVGQSYGGYLARGILSRLKDRIDGLTLICPVIVPEHTQRDVPSRELHINDESFLRNLTGTEHESFTSNTVIANQQTYARYKTEIDPGVRLADKAYLNQLQQRYAFSSDADALIHENPFTMPSLFITGRQDTCVGYQDQWKILEDYPRATFAALDIAGHNLHLDRPKLFNDLVDDWLNRTELSADIISADNSILS